MSRATLLAISGAGVLVAAATLVAIEVAADSEELSVISSVAHSGTDPRLGPDRATVLGSHKIVFLAGGSLSCPPAVASADLSGTTLTLTERNDHLACTADYRRYSVLLIMNQPVFVDRRVSSLRWTDGYIGLRINR